VCGGDGEGATDAMVMPRGCDGDGVRG